MEEAKFFFLYPLRGGGSGHNTTFLEGRKEKRNAAVPPPCLWQEGHHLLKSIVGGRPPQEVFSSSPTVGRAPAHKKKACLPLKERAAASFLLGGKTSPHSFFGGVFATTQKVVWRRVSTHLTITDALFEEREAPLLSRKKKPPFCVGAPCGGEEVKSLSPRDVPPGFFPCLSKANEEWCFSAVLTGEDLWGKSPLPPQEGFLNARFSREYTGGFLNPFWGGTPSKTVGDPSEQVPRTRF